MSFMLGTYEQGKMIRVIGRDESLVECTKASEENMKLHRCYQLWLTQMKGD